MQTDSKEADWIVWCDCSEDPFAIIFNNASRLARYIPGGYSPTRCLALTGRSMMYAVNTNPNYLRLMGVDSGSNRDAAAVGGIVSVWFGGFAIGALMVGTYADNIGRLKTIEVGCFWGILGAALQCSAQNITWMMLARVIGGIGCGHLNTVVPIWTSELADPHLRGAFVAVEFALAIGGSTFVYWMEYACRKLQSEAFAWRFPVAFQMVFLVFVLAAAPFYPDSPRHLARNGQLDEAKDILTRCRADPDPTKITMELEGIQQALQLEAAAEAQTYWTMLTRKDNFHTRRRILLGGGIQVMQKLTGIDFIATYAPEMFSLSGFAGNTPTSLAGGNFISYTASLALAIWLSDHVDRRKLMLSGSVLMGIVLIVGAVLSHEVEKYSGNVARAKQYGAAVATILYVYTALYGSTWLTTCWVYPTEVFPLATRAKGTALATVAFSLAGGLINEIVPYLISAIDFYVFVLFACLNFAILVPVYLFYIETANRNLEDMDLLFSSESPLVWRAERQFAALTDR
ncbi:general substrate transporter [Teratosphaeria nubilosa]|uniref:General substrate transporter n=1 Tax=Teratosphaeria nubilosa TaxID=161662 RepID=A0A6G1LG93_9PEZI|nr:general substrate transporter [Teratosphaeria nubilosa]